MRLAYRGSAFVIIGLLVYAGIVWGKDAFGCIVKVELTKWEMDDIRNQLDFSVRFNRDDLYEPDHKTYPKRCILGSETFSLYAFQTWTRAVENKHIIGEFIWTGMDYIGESGIGFAKEAHTKYPVNTACCGEVDICGFKKTRSYYRDILWDNGTELHIAVRRRPAEGEAFKLSPWGWPEAKSSWTWPDARPSPRSKTTRQGRSPSTPTPRRTSTRR